MIARLVGYTTALSLNFCMGNLAGAGTERYKAVREGKTVGWARPLPMPRRAATATNASQPPRARPLGIGRGVRGKARGGRGEWEKGVECEGGRTRTGQGQNRYGGSVRGLV